MPLKSALLAALAVAITVPAAAFGGFPGHFANEHEATVEKDPTVLLGFSVDRVNGERVATRFDLINIPFSCHDGTSKRRDMYYEDPSATLPVENNRFAGKLTFVAFMVPPQVLKVEGRLLPGDKAAGTMTLKSKGDFPDEICYSGLLRWRDAG